MIFSIIAFIVTIFAVVGFHELGHFLVARWLGFGVQKFSIGFGRAIFSWKGKKGTEYCIGWLPLGGYVKMFDRASLENAKQNSTTTSKHGSNKEILNHADLDASDSPVVKYSNFNGKDLKVFEDFSTWRRALVLAAGPVFNIILAVIAYSLMFMIGVIDISPNIASVTPNSIAAHAGLQAGQRIVTLGDRKINSWKDVNMQLLSYLGDKGKLSIIVINSNYHKQLIDGIRKNNFNGNQIKFKQSPQGLQVKSSQNQYKPNSYKLASLADVSQGNKQNSASLSDGDSGATTSDNLSVGHDYAAVSGIGRGNKVHSKISESGGDVRAEYMPIQLDLSNWKIDPLKPDLLGSIGIKPDISKKYLYKIQYGFFESISQGVHKSYQVIMFDYMMIGKLLTGKMSLKMLGGPVSIFAFASITAHQGVAVFLSFLAMLSISLFILNSLPIPGLDGSYLIYYLIEAVRGKPVSNAAQLLAFKIGMILLLLVFVQVTISDVLKFIL